MEEDKQRPPQKEKEESKKPHPPKKKENRTPNYQIDGYSNDTALRIFQSVMQQEKNKAKAATGIVNEFSDWFNQGLFISKKEASYSNQHDEYRDNISIQLQPSLPDQVTKTVSVTINSKSSETPLIYSKIGVSDHGIFEAKQSDYIPSYPDIGQMLTNIARSPPLGANNNIGNPPYDHLAAQDILNVMQGKMPTHYTTDQHIQLYAEVGALLAFECTPIRDNSFKQLGANLLLLDMIAKQQTYGHDEKAIQKNTGHKRYLFSNSFDSAKWVNGQDGEPLYKITEEKEKDKRVADTGADLKPTNRSELVDKKHHRRFEGDKYVGDIHGGKSPASTKAPAKKDEKGKSTGMFEFNHYLDNYSSKNKILTDDEIKENRVALKQAKILHNWQMQNGGVSNDYVVIRKAINTLSQRIASTKKEIRGLENAKKDVEFWNSVVSKTKNPQKKEKNTRTLNEHKEAFGENGEQSLTDKKAALELLETQLKEAQAKQSQIVANCNLGNFFSGLAGNPNPQPIPQNNQNLQQPLVSNQNAQPALSSFLGTPQPYSINNNNSTSQQFSNQFGPTSLSSSNKLKSNFFNGPNNNNSFGNSNPPPPSRIVYNNFSNSLNNNNSTSSSSTQPNKLKTSLNNTNTSSQPANSEGPPIKKIKTKDDNNPSFTNSGHNSSNASGISSTQLQTPNISTSSQSARMQSWQPTSNSYSSRHNSGAQNVNNNNYQPPQNLGQLPPQNQNNTNNQSFSDDMEVEKNNPTAPQSYGRKK